MSEEGTIFEPIVKKGKIHCQIIIPAHTPYTDKIEWLRKILQKQNERQQWEPIKKNKTVIKTICKIQSEAFRKRFDIDLESTSETFQRI